MFTRIKTWCVRPTNRSAVVSTGWVQDPSRVPSAKSYEQAVSTSVWLWAQTSSYPGIGPKEWCQGIHWPMRRSCPVSRPSLTGGVENVCVRGQWTPFPVTCYPAQVCGWGRDKVPQNHSAQRTPEISSVASPPTAWEGRTKRREARTLVPTERTWNRLPPWGPSEQWRGQCRISTCVCDPAKNPSIPDVYEYSNIPTLYIYTCIYVYILYTRIHTYIQASKLWEIFITKRRPFNWEKLVS